MTESFRIEARPRANGKVYFTSQDLPGFRLLLDHRESADDYRDDILAALEAFYPLFKAAEARQKTPSIISAERPTDYDSGRSFGLVASFAGAG